MVGFSIILFCIFFVLAESQVCTEHGLVSYWEPRAYRKPYTETYRGWCFSSLCDKTRRAYKIVIEKKMMHRIDKVKKCCAGYIKDDNVTLYVKCNPVCFPVCNNGYCDRPGICVCNSGYKPDPENSHNCVPVCNNCSHGSCTAPGVCSCNFGYILNNGLCEPICSDLCINGTCTAPETCECLNGYRKSENNVCKPYCSRGCANGTCTEPEKCSCETGWQHSENDKTECVPKCNPNCIDSTCIAPDKCKCHMGFVKTEGNICSPFCSMGCNNGTCVQPEMCSDHSDNTEQTYKENEYTRAESKIATENDEESVSEADIFPSIKSNTESYLTLCSYDNGECKRIQVINSSKSYWALGVGGATAVIFIAIMMTLIIKQRSKYRSKNTVSI